MPFKKFVVTTDQQSGGEVISTCSSQSSEGTPLTRSNDTGHCSARQHVEIAKELIIYLASPDDTSVMQEKGLEPLSKKS